jgi:N-acetylglucosamine malate deacetylase 1
MNETVLVVAAHPDDDVLGCGGTMARHVNNGDIVHVLFLADGVTSRTSAIGEEQYIDSRNNCAHMAAEVLGVQRPVFLGFPDNKMDTVPLLDVVQTIETYIYKVKPSIVYTHYSEDLNIDHQITHKAVITACRPKPEFCVRKIFSFEVLSSSEWGVGGNKFSPNYFIDISETLDKKILALREYKDEMLDFPNSRSIESIEALATIRGGSVGMFAAEGFIVERMLVD